MFDEFNSSQKRPVVSPQLETTKGNAPVPNRKKNAWRPGHDLQYSYIICGITRYRYVYLRTIEKPHLDLRQLHRNFLSLAMLALQHETFQPHVRNIFGRCSPSFPFRKSAKANLTSKNKLRNHIKLNVLGLLHNEESLSSIHGLGRVDQHNMNYKGMGKTVDVFSSRQCASIPGPRIWRIGGTTSLANDGEDVQFLMHTSFTVWMYMNLPCFKKCIFHILLRIQVADSKSHGSCWSCSLLLRESNSVKCGMLTWNVAATGRWSPDFSANGQSFPRFRKFGDISTLSEPFF